MRILTVAALLLISLGGGSAQRGPAPQRCSSNCVQTVRELIRAREHRVELSWLQKENQRLGDSVSLALLKIYGRRRISKPRNIQAFLPIIKEAFLYPALISDSDNKVPTFTL